MEGRGADGARRAQRWRARTPWSLPSMMRVFATSSGVVTAAANPPATEPASADSHGFDALPTDSLYRNLMCSYSGNWMSAKGISRARVDTYPRKSPCIPLVETMSRTAIDACVYLPACIRCFTISVGTRTMHAETSPVEAAAMCTIGSGVDGLSWCSSAFASVYVPKKSAAPGAEPAAAADKPLYTPLKPPLFKKPSADCSRVLSVSIGKSTTSTDVPAQLPASSDAMNSLRVRSVLMLARGREPSRCNDFRWV
jgi:hypothetical protein